MATVTRMQPQQSMSEDDLLQGFLDRAIHDLRASARQIGTSAELLWESVQNGAVQEGEPSYRRLQDGVASMGSILTGMTSYALTLSNGSYTFRQASLKTALSSALARLRAAVSQTRATITDHGLPEVTGDPDRLSEVFQHLIGNALTYRSKEAPQVEVRASREPNLWRIEVRDNGIGFEPKYCQQVFAPFYRLHGPELPGVGLGLAVCRRILSAHHGQIWIESQKGSGTACIFTLPAGSDDVSES